MHTRALRKFAILPFDLHHLPLPEGGGRLVSALPRFTEMKSFLDRGGHPLNIAHDPPGGDESGSFSRNEGEEEDRVPKLPVLDDSTRTLRGCIYLEVFGVMIIVAEIIEMDISRIYSSE